MMTLISRELFYKSNWVEYNHNQYFMIKDSKTNTLLLEDSIVSDLSRYLNVWNEYLAPINALNVSIGGDPIENVLWWAIDLLLPSSLENIVIL